MSKTKPTQDHAKFLIQQCSQNQPSEEKIQTFLFNFVQISHGQRSIHDLHDINYHNQNSNIDQMVDAETEKIRKLRAANRFRSDSLVSCYNGFDDMFDEDIYNNLSLQVDSNDFSKTSWFDFNDVLDNEEDYFCDNIDKESFQNLSIPISSSDSHFEKTDNQVNVDYNEIEDLFNEKAFSNRFKLNELIELMRLAIDRQFKSSIKAPLEKVLKDYDCFFSFKDSNYKLQFENDEIFEFSFADLLVKKIQLYLRQYDFLNYLYSDYESKYFVIIQSSEEYYKYYLNAIEFLNNNIVSSRLSKKDGEILKNLVVLELFSQHWFEKDKGKAVSYAAYFLENKFSIPDILYYNLSVIFNLKVNGNGNIVYGLNRFRDNRYVHQFERQLDCDCFYSIIKYVKQIFHCFILEYDFSPKNVKILLNEACFYQDKIRNSVKLANFKEIFYYKDSLHYLYQEEVFKF